MRANHLGLHLAIVCLLTGMFAAAPVAQRNTETIRYTASATNLDPTVNVTATLVDFTVTRWSTDAERDRLLGILVAEGQDKLLRVLHDMPRVGTIKTPDSLSYDLRYARRIPGDDGGERVVLITDRPIQMWESFTSSRTLEYPFMVVELRLDSRGRGEGRLTVATKLYKDERTGQIVLENYGTQPVRLTNVKREVD
jgi:hypothetical protein